MPEEGGFDKQYLKKKRMSYIFELVLVTVADRAETWTGGEGIYFY